MSKKTKVVGEIDTAPEGMKFYVCTDHDKHEPGAKVSSIVLAQNESQARELLDIVLMRDGLRGYKMWRYQLRPLDVSKPFAELLNNGDY